jgi:hypothetical protein
MPNKKTIAARTRVPPTSRSMTDVIFAIA